MIELPEIGGLYSINVPDHDQNYYVLLGRYVHSLAPLFLKNNQSILVIKSSIRTILYSGFGARTQKPPPVKKILLNFLVGEKICEDLQVRPETWFQFVAACEVNKCHKQMLLLVAPSLEATKAGQAYKMVKKPSVIANKIGWFITGGEVYFEKNDILYITNISHIKPMYVLSFYLNGNMYKNVCFPLKNLHEFFMRVII